MTDTPEEVAAPTDESLGEKIQHEAQELSENPVISKINDAVDHAEEVIGEHLHHHHHDDEAPSAAE